MIYFDNAATTFPKPRRVTRAVCEAMERYGANPGRSGHKLSLDTAARVYECREAAAELFGAEVDQVVFTSNCSHALNIAIKGALRQGDHVIISDLEHNSVLRPVHALARRELISYSVAETGPDDDATVAAFEALITDRTRLIACTHASNAFGIRLPVERLCEMAHRHEILFLVDAAQTAGVLPIDVKRTGIDFLCTAGHKCLYGPSGTGLLITPFGEYLSPLMEGGTGSASAQYDMPDIIPDRLECGTVNTAGILGLGAGLSFVREKGIGALHRQETRLCTEIDRQLRAMPRAILYTPPFSQDRNVPVISFNLEEMSSEELTEKLSAGGFALRGGLHCAPLAHRKMATLELGAARISVGAMNTMQQAEQLCMAVRHIARKK